MEKIIAGGGSVLHQGQILSTVAQLPTEAALASTDAEKADAAEALHAKVAALQAQIDALSATQPGAAPAPAPAEKTARKAEAL
jgi:hypothetical protein